MIKIEPVPAFEDNYIWMLIDESHATAACVDPGDAQVVLDFLSDKGLTLTAILITHHHPDHIGGISRLLQDYSVPVFYPANETIPHGTEALVELDVVDVPGMQVSLKVIDVPGHTSGHIAYYADQLDDTSGAPILFCGDTLFSGGCGYLFEGTPAQMHHSLSKLAKLPENTRVFCTHEYTLANLEFASVVQPNNDDLSAYQSRCKKMRQQNEPTLPSTIATERAINPFLRCAEPEVIDSVTKKKPCENNEVAIFAELRSWKNNF